MIAWSVLTDSLQRLAQRVHRRSRLRLAGGHLVLPSRVIEADLVIQGEHIADARRDNRSRTDEEVIDVSGLLVFPGLINAHDHLEFNCFPRLGTPHQYPNSYEWGLDITQRRRSPVLDRVLEIPIRDRLLAGGFKNLFSGVTTVCHHNPYWRWFDQEFPVQVVKHYRWCHSLGFGGDVTGSYRRTPPNVPWIIHLAEGTDPRAQRELTQLAEMGCLGANTVIVHGVGLREADIDLMAQRGAGLIWCPASNLFMFGQTAPIEHLKSRVTIAVGSDSRLSGSEDLLAELKVARRLGLASDEELFYMVTRDAARLLRIDGQVGSIEPGKQADLLVLAGNVESPYQALISAPPETIRLVLIGGRPAYGVPEFIEFFQASGRPFSQIIVGDHPYLLAGTLPQILVPTESNLEIH